MRKSNVWLVILLAMGSSILHAGNITVKNKTGQKIFVRGYHSYVFKDKVSAGGSEVEIPANGSRSISRPKYKFGTNRRLAVATSKKKLKGSYSKKSFKKVPSVYIGVIQGKTFYIAKKKSGSIKALSTLEWEARKAKDWFEAGAKKVESGVKHLGTSVVAFFEKSIADKIIQDQRAFQKNSHKHSVAKVRVGNELSPQEKQAVTRREAVVKNAIEKKLDQTISYVPKISIVASGGGYRAMICTLGSLAGAYKEGLLDMVTWGVGLSGSTWAIGSYMAHAQHEYKMFKKFLPMHKFSDEFVKQISNKDLGLPPLTPKEIKLITDDILVTAVLKQPFTLVNLYGPLLANRLLASFGDDRHIVYLSEQAGISQTGQTFIPIYTSVHGASQIKNERLDWYEFTPWEVGGNWLGMYTPTWGYGRKFNKGSSSSFGLEKTLGFNFGTFGSAFAARVEEIYDQLKGDIKVGIVKKLIENLIIKKAGQKRLAWAEVPNFTRGMQNSPMKDKKTLRMVDAGLSFNLPYPPVSGERSERASDVIIFIDASLSVDDAINEMRGVVGYAQWKGLKFPKIDFKGISKRSISVFKDESDPTVPVVIYMPRINDKSLWSKLSELHLNEYEPYVKGFDVERCVEKDVCDTFNFKYKVVQARRLSKLTEFNMRANADKIFKEIAKVIQARATA